MLSKTRKNSIKPFFKPCACGCGQNIRIPNRWYHYDIKYIKGHYKARNGRVYQGEYVKILMPEHREANRYGYIFEHRHIWEKHNKAYLLPWSDVHHKNGVHDDNRPENLEAMMHYKHSSLTMQSSFRKQGKDGKFCK